MEIKSVVVALAALAHPTRLSVFRMLVQVGHQGIASGEIARRLDVPPNTLSTNLNILANVGLVENRREGRSVIYVARYTQMTELLDYLIQDCCGGSPEICAPLADLVLSSRCGSEGRA